MKEERERRRGRKRRRKGGEVIEKVEEEIRGKEGRG